MLKRSNFIKPAIIVLSLYIILGAIGISVLLGWILEFKSLQSWHPSYVSMNPLTAVCLLSLTASLSLSQYWPQKKFLAICLILFALVAAPLRYVLLLFGLEFGLDHILFSEFLNDNRVAPNTSLLLSLLALAQILRIIDVRLSSWAEYLVLASFFLSLFSLSGYLYDIEAFYGPTEFIPMAINTAFGLTLLSLAQFFTNLKSKSHFASIFSRSDMGGKVMRIFAPAVLIVPLFCGWFFYQGYKIGFYGRDLQLSMALMTITVFFLFLSWLLAKKISKLEGGLKKEKQILDLVLSSMIDGVIVADSRGNLTRVNPKAEEMLGVDLLLQKPEVWQENYFLYDVDKKSKIAFSRNPLKYALQAKKSDRVQQYIKYKGKEKGRYIRFSSRPLVDSDGNARGGVVVIRDISQQKIGEKKILRSNERLKLKNYRQDEEIQESKHQVQQLQKMDAVGRLAAGVAHDFNNILAAIQLYSDMCVDKLDNPEEIKRYADQIKQASEKGASLTRQLLVFTKQDNEHSEILDLNDVITHHMVMLERLLPSNIKIEAQLDKSIWNIYADRGQLEQILMNLVVNARDALDEQMGTIKIQTKNTHLEQEKKTRSFNIVPGDYVLLSISDDGHGIDDALIDKVFEPFYTTKPQGQGTGLGLSIVYGIISEIGGGIEVFSKKNHGTIFYFYLPISSQERLTFGERPPLMASQDLSLQTILLAEDDEELRGLTANILIQNGHTVLVSEDEEDAINLLKDSGEEVDILLTDLSMQGMGGLELSKKCRQLVSRLKVLYVSGTIAGEVKEQIEKNHDFEFLQKPYDSQVLLETIQALSEKN